MSFTEQLSVLADVNQRPALVKDLPDQLDLAHMALVLHRCCGVLVPDDDEGFRQQVAGWYAEFRRLSLPRLPLVVPYFLDLASLIVHEQPPFRVAQAEQDSQRRQYLATYVDGHLVPLFAQPAVRLVRRRLTHGYVRPKVAALVVARFVRQIMLWLRGLWERHSDDCRWLVQDRSAQWLSREDASEEFICRNAQLVAQYGDLRDAIPPLERFLLGAMAHDEGAQWQDEQFRGPVHDAFKQANGELIACCADSPDLEQRFFQPPPVITKAGHWSELSTSSGERVSVRQVRKTTELRRLGDVIPQDLTLLRSGDDGVRQFLHKMTQEGALIWDRQHYTERTARKLVLVCFAAVVGETANYAPSAFYLNPRIRGGQHAAASSDSLDTRARQLIFDFLRDIGDALRASTLRLDLQVLLQDIRDERCRMWHMTSEELDACVIGDRFDFMVELETRVPGYFLDTKFRTVAAPGAPREFVERAFYADGDDGKVFVLLGPPGRLQALVPDGLHRRLRDPRRDAVKLVQLAESPDEVYVAAAANFDDPKLRWHFVPTGNMDLRYSVLEAVFGPPRAGRGAKGNWLP